jgi:hypothetical protein
MAPMNVQQGWPYTPGNEMFTTGRIDLLKRGYAELLNIPKESVIITPYGHQPLVQLPPGDHEGRHRLPASMSLEWARHPMFWLDPETRFRYPDEDEWTWAIRINLELIVRNLYNPETGTCIDALLYFCDIDLNDPVDRRRVETYRDGGYDQLLCEFWIPRDSRLTHTESRQLSLASAEALLKSYKANKELDREAALARLNFERTAVVNGPMIFDKGLTELDIISNNFVSAVTQGAHHDHVFAVKRQFSEHLTSIATFLKNLHGYTVALNFVVILHTEAWKYQTESQQLLAWTYEKENQRRAMLEDAVSFVYQQPQNPHGYANIRRMVSEWFDEIYRYGYDQVEKVNILAEGNRLFKQYEQHGAEPTLQRTEIGRERWNMGGWRDPLSDDSEER